MSKKKIIILTILLFSIFILPMNTEAKEMPVLAQNNSVEEIYNSDINNNKISSNFDVLANNCESLLGSKSDNKSLAWLINEIFKYIKILGPILVVVLSAIDFTKVIIESDNEAMAKAQKTLFTRLILAICLFLIPTLVELLLDVFGLQGTCNIK